MKVPTIHLNGTSRERLIEQLAEAHAALVEAERLLAQASPNARDYYVQGAGAYQQADDEHRSRLQRVGSVARELRELVEAIDAQGMSVARDKELPRGWEAIADGKLYRWKGKGYGGRQEVMTTRHPGTDHSISEDQSLIVKNGVPHVATGSAVSPHKPLPHVDKDVNKHHKI